VALAAVPAGLDVRWGSGVIRVAVVAGLRDARRIDAAQLEVGRELRGAGYEAGPGRRAPE